MKNPFAAVRTEIGAFELALLQATDELDRLREAPAARRRRPDRRGARDRRE